MKLTVEKSILVVLVLSSFRLGRERENEAEKWTDSESTEGSFEEERKKNGRKKRK